MKKAITILGLVVIIVAGLFMFFNPMAWFFAPRSVHEPVATTTPTATTTNQPSTTTSTQPVQTIATNLSVPWGLAFLPNGNLLVTERTGQLKEFDAEGNIVNQQAISGVAQRGEGGLLGVALHPDFFDNRQLYLYETYESGQGTRNRVVRYVYEGGRLSEQAVIIDEIPGANYHDGGRIAFGPPSASSGQADKKHLFVTTGDAGSPQEAQATNTLNGKILRLNPDGSIPEPNPFDNAVYSYGHRNPQGLAWDQGGRLFSTEHGRSGIKSGLDEVNLIASGSNYGWPYFEGDESCGDNDTYDPPTPEGLSGNNCNVTPPMTHSGPDITWAPASAAIANNTLYFGGLRGQTVYTAPIQMSSVELRLGQIQAYFKEEFGRIRTVTVGPNEEYLYITTSNTDGRGTPQEGDDKIIRIKLSQFTQ